MEFKEHPGYSTQHKRANANFAPDSSSLSLSLVPGRKRTIEGARLTGKRPTNSGIKWRFTYGIEAWGWKMRRGRTLNRHDFSSRVSNSNRERGFVPFEPIFTATGRVCASNFRGTACDCFFFSFFFLRWTFIRMENRIHEANPIRGFNLGWMMEAEQKWKFFLREERLERKILKLRDKPQVALYLDDEWVILTIQFFSQTWSLNSYTIAQLSRWNEWWIPFPPVREDRLARFIFKLIPFSNEGKRERREEKSEEGQTVEGKRAQFLSRNRSPAERKQVETERKVKIRTFRFIVRARREVNDS